MARMKEIYMDILEKYGHEVEVTPELVREYFEEKTKQEESK
jgi:hypothetical protein